MLFGILFPALAVPADNEVAVPAEDDWLHLSFEKRHERMTFVVHPTLAERYQEFYATPEPRLTCRTCHGADGEARRYQIAYTPIDDLDPERVRRLYLPGVELSAEQRFKRDIVTPLMARLLGVAAYDPASGQGFSCFGCHPRE